MNTIDLILLGILAAGVYTAATGRLSARVAACALQGALLAALAFVIGRHHGLLVVGLAAGAVLVFKALVIPVFLRRAVRRSGVRREAEPHVSLHVPLLIAGLLAGLAFWLGGKVPLPSAAVGTLGARVGLATLLLGLYMIIRGRTELAQVIGYLVAENGVFVFGQIVFGGVPLIIEMGVLLDVLVAGMLMTVLLVARHAEPAAAPEREPDAVELSEGGAP